MIKKIKKREEKIKMVNRSVYFFSIEVSSLNPIYNNNIKNIFIELNRINGNKVLTNTNDETSNFSTLIKINNINDNTVFLTYGRKETAIQRSGRAEVDLDNLSLIFPNYTSDNREVYFGYCVINLSKNIGAFLSTSDISPENCIKSTILKQIPEINLNIYDIGKNKKEIKDLKKDIKKLTQLSYVARNLPANDIKIPFGNSLPILKANVKVIFDDKYISPNQLESSLDQLICNINDDSSSFLSDYESLSFNTISSNDFEQFIDLKRNMTTKKSVVTFPETNLYDSSILEQIITTELNKFIDDYKLSVN